METAVARRANIFIALALIAIAVLLRVLPHPPNFAPVAAVALFGGAVLPRKYGLITPVAAMVVSDLVIGLHSLVLVTWGTYALIALAGSYWLKKGSVPLGAFLAVSSSVFFFLVSNFAVWVEGKLYPHTFAGLGRCFELALPFFRNTFLSDIVYTAGLFGLYALTVKASGHFTKLSVKKIEV